QTHAATQHEAVHQRQDRFGIGVDQLIQRVLLAEEGHVHAVAGQVAVVQAADVAAGAEGLLAIGAQYRRLDALVLLPDVQLTAQPAYRVEVQSVESGRPVRRQVTDAVAHLAQYSLLAHLIAPLDSLMIAERSRAPLP